MFGKRAAAGATEIDGDGGTAVRRVGRGWGPFSGGQLTIIIVALAAVIGFPVAAFAVTGTNSFITDPTSGVQAKVTSTGQLQTHPNGPLAVVGSVTAIPGSGNVTGVSGQINVTGTWHTIALLGIKQTINSINVDTWAVAPGINDAIQFGESSNNCATIDKTVEAVNPGSIGVTSVDLGAGLVLGPGIALCVIDNDVVHLHAAVFFLYNT